STDTSNGTGGEVTWSFQASDATLNQLAAGQVVHETYTVTLNNTRTGSRHARDVEVTISVTNDAPVIGVAQLTGAVSEDATVPTESACGTIAFSDMDLSDTHVASAAFSGSEYPHSLPTRRSSDLSTDTSNGTGGEVTWSFQASDATLNQLAAGQVVHETYT